MTATMRGDHPGVEDFAAARQDNGRLRMLDLSVVATDDFMAAARAEATGRWQAGLAHLSP